MSLRKFFTEGVVVTSDSGLEHELDDSDCDNKFRDLSVQTSTETEMSYSSDEDDKKTLDHLPYYLRCNFINSQRVKK